LWLLLAWRCCWEVSFWCCEEGEIEGDKPWDRTAGSRIAAQERIGGSECVHGGRLRVVVCAVFGSSEKLSFGEEPSTKLQHRLGEGMSLTPHRLKSGNFDLDVQSGKVVWSSGYDICFTTW
jgi:hypothetical protein